MEITPITRRLVDLPVTGVGRDGTPATIAGVDVALLSDRGAPTAITEWMPTTYEGGVATFLLVGPDADPTGALVVPRRGAHLWLRVVGNPEVDAVRVEKITIL